MASVTRVYFDRIWELDGDSRIFVVLEPIKETICVKSCWTGWTCIAKFDSCLFTSIELLAAIVAGCFNEESNFEDELCKAFDYDEGTSLIGIEFELNGVPLFVTYENADVNKICAEWEVRMQAKDKKQQLKRKSYMKSEEYEVKWAKERKIGICKESVQNDAIAVDESTKLEFKDEEAEKNWANWVEINSKDIYSLGVVTYAQRWGKYMQHLIEKHNKTVADIAEKASFASDVEGISGFIHCCAVDILSQCWKYGEELREWNIKEWDRNGWRCQSCRADD